ncbi:MOSC domain-containing protein [Dendryphion nanum]|uniref:MOSC domain-containing protein n=1 Tax=Dendryphion nanum TaxID=256645 RepID=A0A9P9DLR0_9PLEO|nr:MOSC domain-containing protein [Dendryphion nanum]
MPAVNALDVALDHVYTFFKNANIRISPLAVGVTSLALLLPLVAFFILALTQKEEKPSPPAGCRRIGLQGPSNLSDQHAKKYSQGAAPSEENAWKVKALFIYPVKSCAGIELDKTDVIRTGLQYDREFTFAQQVTGLPDLNGKVKSEWRFITQRTFPRLAKVETEIWVPDPDASGYNKENEWVQSDGCLIIRFPFTPDTEFSINGLKAYGKILAAKLAGKPEPTAEFRIPFNPTKERIKKMKYRSEKMKIWTDIPTALNMSVEVPPELLAKLKYTLGVTNPLALFRIDTTQYRELYMCAPKKDNVGFQPIIGMQDSYPMHIMNLASVHDVSSKLPKGYSPLNALRYRANVYLTGPPAFNEDEWKKARIGSLECHISCRTTRCKLPNVDPETAITDRNQPSTAMLKYRVIDDGSKCACLGMQVTPLADGGIKIGDEVKVLERGEHHFLKE